MPAAISRSRRGASGATSICCVAAVVERIIRRTAVSSCSGSTSRMASMITSMVPAIIGLVLAKRRASRSKSSRSRQAGDLGGVGAAEVADQAVAPDRPGGVEVEERAVLVEDEAADRLLHRLLLLG